MRELAIWMDGRRLGTLDGTDSRNLRIAYNESWRTASDSTPLSISMPLVTPVHSGKTVSAYLWGLLPDNEQVIAKCSFQLADSRDSPSRAATENSRSTN
jgi:serine/threonine-protein kinase HipA